MTELNVVKKTKGECSGTSVIVCPYCGYEDDDISSDDWGPQDKDESYHCYECEKEFYKTTDYRVVFYTKPIEGWKE